MTRGQQEGVNPMGIRAERAFCFLMLCLTAPVALLTFGQVSMAVARRDWSNAIGAAIVSFCFYFAVWAYARRDKVLARQQEAAQRVEASRGEQRDQPAADGGRLDWSETDRKLGEQVWRFIDRMNDLTDEDNADKVLSEFRAAVNPIFDEAIRAKGFRG